MAEVDILMSTFNGERFLKEQLISIAAQSCGDWNLIVRDDASSDQTVNILNDFSKSLPKGKITIHRASENIGPAASYTELLTYSSSPYIMFADQDDVWLPEKILTLKNAMSSLEKQYGENTPLAVFSDMKVVDDNLHVLGTSFFDYNKLPVSLQNLSQIFFINNIPACSMLVNRALVDFAMPFPKESIMHDWWLNLCVNVSGESIFVPQPLFLYRLHSQNFYGTGQSRLKKYWQIKKYRTNFNKMIRQLYAFEKKYGHLIQNEKSKKAICQLGNMDKYNFIRRKITVLKYVDIPGKKLRKLFLLLLV